MMMRLVFGLACLGCWNSAASAAPTFPLESLLKRAKHVHVVNVTSFDGRNVTLKVETGLRGDRRGDRMTFTVDATFGKPEKATP